MKPWQTIMKNWLWRLQTGTKCLDQTRTWSPFRLASRSKTTPAYLRIEKWIASGKRDRPYQIMSHLKILQTTTEQTSPTASTSSTAQTTKRRKRKKMKERARMMMTTKMEKKK